MLLLFFSAAALGQSTNAIPPLKLQLEKNAGKNILHILPPKGHHINIQAPIVCDAPDANAVRKTHASSSSVELMFSKTRTPCTISVYLCDEGNTYCVKKTSRIEDFEKIPLLKSTKSVDE